MVYLFGVAFDTDLLACMHVVMSVCKPSAELTGRSMAELTSRVNLLLTGCVLLSFGCNLRAVPSLLIALLQYICTNSK